MKVVFGGAFALIVLGIILHFGNIATSWVVFCVACGLSTGFSFAFKLHPNNNYYCKIA
jgi:uncharacterized membrane protein